MVDTGIFATTAEVGYKAGANASSVSKAEAYVNSYMTQVESYINIVTRFNWSDAYAALNVDVKGILKAAASDLAAMYVINYDMGGFSSRQEAQTMLDVLRDRANAAIDLLREKAHTDYMSGA